MGQVYNDFLDPVLDLDLDPDLECGLLTVTPSMVW
jgi:hypothetical protein